MEVYPLQLTTLRSSEPDEMLPIQLSMGVCAGSPLLLFEIQSLVFWQAVCSLPCFCNQ